LASAERYAAASKGASALPRDRQVALDRQLMKMERALTLPGGLPGRPWYVHHIYAPGRYTGYGVKTLPGAREAIELREWAEAEKQIVIVSKVIEGYAAEVDAASALARVPAAPAS